MASRCGPTTPFLMTLNALIQNETMQGTGLVICAFINDDHTSYDVTVFDDDTSFITTDTITPVQLASVETAMPKAVFDIA